MDSSWGKKWGQEKRNNHRLEEGDEEKGGVGDARKNLGPSLRDKQARGGTKRAVGLESMVSMLNAFDFAWCFGSPSRNTNS